MVRKSKKSKASSLKDLRAKAIDAKRGRAVKGGDKSGKVSHADFSITRPVDAASPKLYQD